MYIIDQCSNSLIGFSLYLIITHTIKKNFIISNNTEKLKIYEYQMSTMIIKKLSDTKILSILK